jgi:hypothetical protein
MMALESEATFAWPNQHSESSWPPDHDRDVGESSEDSATWCEIEMDVRESANSNPEVTQNDLSIMSATRKSSYGAKAVSAWKGRRKNHRNYIHEELYRELDETVASVEKFYLSPKPMGDDDSVASQSIATQDDHAIYVHRNLIDNIALMSTGSPSPVSAHVTSNSSRTSQRKSRTSRSSRCSISKCRRKRGDSLEREIVSTVLRVEAESISSKKAEKYQEITVRSTADFILKDLHQICAILKCELEPSFTAFDSGRQRGRFNPELPPIQSESALAENEDEENVSHETLNPGAIEVRDVNEENDYQGVAFGSITYVYDDIPSSPHHEPVSSQTPADIEPRDCDADYIQTDPTSPMIEFVQRNQSDLESAEWTMFNENPFETSSSDSPSSVAHIEESHFTKIRPWKSSELGWRNVTVST